MTQCKGRVTKESLKVVFSDNKHYFYLELKCPNPVTSGTLCLKCSTRNTTCAQSSKSFNHGCIDEPIPEKSHIFDSAWYHKSVKAYGQPTEEVLEKAMEAQKKARQGKHVISNTVVPTRKPRVKKQIQMTDVKEALNSIPVGKMIETMDEPLEVSDIIYVTLKPFTHNSVTYWRDEKREKLYKNTNGQKGPYVGRWNEGIHTIPDSDED